MNKLIRSFKIALVAIMLSLGFVACDTSNNAKPKDDNALAAVQKEADGKWGYINKKGEVVIDFEYSAASPFSNGLAPVQKERRWGYINAKGEEVIDFIYQSASPFYGDFARVSQEGSTKSGMINRKGEFVIPCGYSEVVPFVDGLSMCRNGSDYSYYDTNGTEIISGLSGASPNPFGGIGAVKQGRYWGFVDKNGNKIGEMEYDDVWNFTPINSSFFSNDRNANDVLLAAVEKAGKAGFINTKGEYVIPADYTNAYPFSQGLAAVQSINDQGEKKWGFIDTKGELVVPEIFDDVYFYFSEGLIGVKKYSYNLSEDDKKNGNIGGYGFINTKGELIVKHQYDGVDDFYNGVAAVKRGHFWGFINKEGKEVIPTQYKPTSPNKSKEVYPANVGTILVMSGDGRDVSFFNLKGEQLFKETFEKAWFFTNVDEELPYWTRVFIF